MNDTIPRVIDQVVNQDLCIGCGLCIYKCPSNALKMGLNGYGFLVPEIDDQCHEGGECLSVCPFNPFPEDDIKTEDELSDSFLIESEKHHPKIGRYEQLYVGYSEEFRLTSSSGGLATYLLKKLLDRGIVQHIFSVKESTKEGFQYEYVISSSSDDLLKTSKTKYYPVSLATVMPQIHQLNGKVAIVGVGCFIKAIRLAQKREPALKEKIAFLIGIICGGVKSKFFTEYLSERAGVDRKKIDKPEFRIKDLESTAGDYSFGVEDKELHIKKLVKMSTVGDMWGTGMFKANACDFCDDVTTELADISLGDAWLQPYNKDGKGTSVVVARSKKANELVQAGIQKRELMLEELSQETFLASQQGSFNHRHKALNYRIKKTSKQKKIVPPKRFINENISFDFRWVQYFRLKVRRLSLKYWSESKDLSSFEKKMNPKLNTLKKFTLFYHYKRALLKKIFRL